MFFPVLVSPGRLLRGNSAHCLTEENYGRTGPSCPTNLPGDSRRSIFISSSFHVSLTLSPTDYIQHIGSTLASLSPCSIPQRLYRQAQSLLRSLLPWSNIASKTGIQYSRTMWHKKVVVSLILYHLHSHPYFMLCLSNGFLTFYFFSALLSFSGAQVIPFSLVFPCTHQDVHAHPHSRSRTAFSTLCRTQYSGSTCVWLFTCQNIPRSAHCSHKIRSGFVALHAAKQGCCIASLSNVQCCVYTEDCANHMVGSCNNHGISFGYSGIILTHPYYTIP